jgi:hypothetical protein
LEKYASVFRKSLAAMGLSGFLVTQESVQTVIELFVSLRATLALAMTCGESEIAKGVIIVMLGERQGLSPT